MKTFSVSLLVRSSSLSLDELTLHLRWDHTGGSHTKGEPHSKDRPPWSETVWRFDSGVSKNAPLQDHLEDLNIRFPPSELRRNLPENCTVCVDVAIFFDTLTVSASLPHSAVKITDAYGAELEMTCYPTLSESGEKMTSS